MKVKHFIFSLAALIILLLVLRCARQEQIEEEWDGSALITSAVSLNSTDTANWVSLFDGKTLEGWISGGSQADGSCWMVQNGVLKGRSTGADKQIQLSTEKEYQFYELKMQWRLTHSSMASIAYKTAAGESAPDQGLHYQLADDLNLGSQLAPELCTGALSNLLRTTEKRIRVAGSWNTSRIIVKQELVQHWLNNELILEYSLRDARPSSSPGKLDEDIRRLLGTPAPVALIACSGEVEFRNILIRENPEGPFTGD